MTLPKKKRANVQRKRAKPKGNHRPFDKKKGPVDLSTQNGNAAKVAEIKTDAKTNNED